MLTYLRQRVLVLLEHRQRRGVECLAQAEITQFDVPIDVQQDVVGLQVSVRVCIYVCVCCVYRKCYMVW
jgi:hypothetical protein